MKGIVFLLCFVSIYGHMHFRFQLPNGFNVSHPCPGKGVWEAVGHMENEHTVRKNVFGLAFKKNGFEWTRALCKEDSDGDGLTNGEELGDALCKWVPGAMVPGPVKGHPGFCEPDRPSCTSGMTYHECPNPKAKNAAPKRPRVKLPPGANDHPQTLKFKEMMRMQNRNTQAMNTVARTGFTAMPAVQGWLPRENTVMANNGVQPTASSNPLVRNDWQPQQQPVNPTVGQSVFAQDTSGTHQNTGNTLNDRQSQTPTLTRDFGMTIESPSRGNSMDANRLNRFANIARQNSRFVSSPGDLTTRVRTVNRSPSRNVNSVVTSIDVGRPRRPARWNSFSDQQHARRDSRVQSGSRFVPEPLPNRNSFDRFSRNNGRPGVATMSDRPQRGDMHASPRGAVSNSLTGGPIDQSIPWASYPMMPGIPRPGMPRPGMPGVPFPGEMGSGIRLPPFFR